MYRVSFPGYKLGLGMRLLASVPQSNTLVLTTCHHCTAISSNINAVNRAWKNISAFRIVYYNIQVVYCDLL